MKARSIAMALGALVLLSPVLASAKDRGGRHGHRGPESQWIYSERRGGTEYGSGHVQWWNVREGDHRHAHDGTHRKRGHDRWVHGKRWNWYGPHRHCGSHEHRRGRIFQGGTRILLQFGW